MRRVVLLFGPPGAGKTTLAKQSGLTVFDRDDAHWHGEKQFRQAIEQLRGMEDVQAVVIRAGASSRSRVKWSRLVGGTHGFLVSQPREVLARRIYERGRADSVQSMAALNFWFESFDHEDGCPYFSDWSVVFGEHVGRVSSRFGG